MDLANSQILYRCSCGLEQVFPLSELMIDGELPRRHMFFLEVPQMLCLACGTVVSAHIEECPDLWEPPSASAGSSKSGNMGD